MRNDTITIEPDPYGRGDALFFGHGNMGTSIVIDADDEAALLDLLQRRSAQREQRTLLYCGRAKDHGTHEWTSEVSHVTFRCGGVA